MIVGILKEPIPDKRVVCLPEIVGQLVKMNIRVLVESGAGVNSFATDEEYKQAGAEISNEEDNLSQADRGNG